MNGLYRCPQWIQWSVAKHHRWPPSAGSLGPCPDVSSGSLSQQALAEWNWSELTTNIRNAQSSMRNKIKLDGGQWRNIDRKSELDLWPQNVISLFLSPTASKLKSWQNFHKRFVRYGSQSAYLTIFGRTITLISLTFWPQNLISSPLSPTAQV